MAARATPGWRWSAIGLLVLLLASGVWGGWQFRQRRQAELALNTRYQQQFFDAIAHIDNVEVLLTKGLVATSPGIDATLLGDVWRQAFAAQANLSQLPLTQGALMRTARFLTQVGDFSFVLARQAAEGRPLSNEQVDTLSRLRNEAAVLNTELRGVVRQVAGGPFYWEEVRRAADRRAGRWSPNRADPTAPADGAFARIDKRMNEFPTLTYDGPFSDHVRDRKPLGLSGKTITREQAQEIALRFLPAGGSGLSAQTVGSVDDRGVMPAFAVEMGREGTKADGTGIRVDVTQKGGEIVWMLNPRRVPEARLSDEEAIERARAFLAERGVPAAAPTFISRSENRAVIPFAPVQDGVLLYPDLLKVTVALDNGEIVGYEARSFLMSHRERDLPRPRLSADQVKMAVSSRLQVDGAPRLALIPREDLKEVLTYEVRARSGNDQYLVYVNAQDGRQERILNVVPTPNGRLTL